MSVAFSTTRIYEYMFSEEPGAPATHELRRESVAEFCRVLEQEISRHGKENPHYKYVFMDLGEDAIRDFFLCNRHRFLDFGDTVVFTGECSAEVARRIEECYDDPIVTNALRLARHAIRASSE